MYTFGKYEIDPEKVLMENKLAFAIYNINPVAKEHVLIITKRHVDNVLKLNGREAAAVNTLRKKMAKYLIKNDSSIIAFNFRTNVGEIAGQTIRDYHEHMIPRREGDGLGPIACPKGNMG